MALPFNLPPELLTLAQAGITWAQKNGVNTPALPQTAAGNVGLQTNTPGAQRPPTYAGQAAASQPVAGRAPRTRDPTAFAPQQQGNLNPALVPTPFAGIDTTDLLVLGGIGLFFWKFLPLIRQG